MQIEVIEQADSELVDETAKFFAPVSSDILALRNNVCNS